MNWIERFSEALLVTDSGRIVASLIYNNGRWHDGWLGPSYIDLESAKSAVECRLRGPHP